jgi:transposase
MTTTAKLTTDPKPILFIGIDVHLDSWDVSIYSEHTYVKSFRQPPSADLLSNYLSRKYPYFKYKSVYEAGFCGFRAHKELEDRGIDNIIINPADLPSTNKTKTQKRDRIDSRKLAISLRAGQLNGIYVPSDERLSDRLLLRTRGQIKKDLKRCKNRIKSNFHFLGIRIPEEFSLSGGYWNRAFMRWLKDVSLEHRYGRLALDNQIAELEYLTNQLKVIDKEIILLSQENRYAAQVRLLRTIPGVSLLSAMQFLTEIIDIKRFDTFDVLSSYVGLIPNVYASGEKEYSGEMTRRSNDRIRKSLIESSWWLIRKDPAMTAAYEGFRKRMNANKAIVKIARKLLSRIRYILVTGEPYQFGIT